MEAIRSMKRPGVVTAAIAILGFTAVMFAALAFGSMTGSLGDLASFRPESRSTAAVVLAAVSGACAAGALGLWMRRAWARRYGAGMLCAFMLICLFLAAGLGLSEGIWTGAALCLLFAATYGSAGVALARSAEARPWLVGRAENRVDRAFADSDS